MQTQLVKLPPRLSTQPPLPAHLAYPSLASFPPSTPSHTLFLGLQLPQGLNGQRRNVN